MRGRSIRFRLTVWYAALLTAGLGLFSVLVWLSLRHQLMADLDNELAGRATRLESYLRTQSATKSGDRLRAELEEFCAALPPASYVAVRGASGFEFRYPTDAPAEQPPLHRLQRRFALQGEAFDLEVSAPTASVQYVLQLLGYLLLILVPVVIAIACLGGAWLSRRALKPVQDVTAAALTISIENLSDRLPVPATGDELARLAEVLNSMLGRLEAAVKTLSQFVADASHELRTPLAVIRTTAELALRRGRSPESYRESLEGVVAETERMTGLVEDLLILARSDAGVLQMPRSPVDARDILRDVCAEMHGIAQARRIEIQVAPGDEPAIISANRPALHRLFVILLDNAVKYSRSGGTVLVTVDGGAARVSITVKDNGSGVSAVDLPHIFERFYRSDRARNGGGHGLGLPLAETIARAHGAVIEVQSVEGSGSTFRVAFAPCEAGSDWPTRPARSGALAQS